MAAPLPPDLPDDPVDGMPVFTSRQKAALLPPLRPAEPTPEPIVWTGSGAWRRLRRAFGRRGLAAVIIVLGLVLVLVVGRGQ